MPAGSVDSPSTNVVGTLTHLGGLFSSGAGGSSVWE